MLIEPASLLPSSATPKCHRCLCQGQKCRRHYPPPFVFNDPRAFSLSIATNKQMVIFIPSEFHFTMKIQAPGKQAVLEINQGSIRHKWQSAKHCAETHCKKHFKVYAQWCHQGRSPHKKGRKPILLGFRYKDNSCQKRK